MRWRAGPVSAQSTDDEAHVRDDDEGWGQRRPRVKFPDEAIALRLPIEVAVALYFAKGVAVGTRGQGSLEFKAQSGSVDVRHYVQSTRWQTDVRINVRGCN